MKRTGAIEESDLHGTARRVYLVKRGPRPEHHRAPFHPVILCSFDHTAKWESQTSYPAWVWVHLDPHTLSSGWLIDRWNGLLVDHSQPSGILPDGGRSGFQHDRDKEPWTLLSGVVWWSHHKIPAPFAERGVHLPDDEFSLVRIWEDTGSFLLGREKEWKLQEKRRARLEL